MSEMKHLEKIQHELICCTGCGYCKKSCPTFDLWGTEADSGRGKIFLSYGLMSGEITEDNSVIEALQKCPLCGRCEQDCPSLVRITDIIRAARKDVHGILPAHQSILDNIADYGNPFGKMRNEKEGQDGKGSKIAYFSGCMENYFEEGLKKAAISIFKKVGIEVMLVDNECCGSPIDTIGGENHQIEKLEKQFEEKGVEKIIFSCPDCMNSFIPLKEKFEILHISEFLAGMDLNIENTGTKFIYHDPSVLGRKLGIYEEPRKLIEKAGRLVEFDENRELSQCCGSDLAFRTAFPDAAGEMARKIADEAKEKGAVLVTASPHCYHHLKEYGNVMDIVEVVDRYLRQR